MKKISDFPSVDELERRMQSLAALDAIMCPEWEYRYFSYDNDWAPGATMGSIRDGSGDHVFVLFSEEGCFIKEFYHESGSILEAYAPVPAAFSEATREPAFSPENVTTCFWRSRSSGMWHMNGIRGQFDPENSALLAMVDGKPETYESFAAEYFEVHLPPKFVAQIFNQETLTMSHLENISFEGNLEELGREIARIGYPNELPKRLRPWQRFISIFKTSGR